MQLGPDVGGGNIDGGVLPEGSLGAGEAADVEAVKLHQLSGTINFEVKLGLRISPLRNGQGGVAGHQRQAA